MNEILSEILEDYKIACMIAVSEYNSTKDSTYIKMVINGLHESDSVEDVEFKSRISGMIAQLNDIMGTGK